MKKVIWAWILTPVLWLALIGVVVFAFYKADVEIDMKFLAKLIPGIISYIQWGRIVVRRRKKLQREIDELIQKDGEALGGALEDVRTKRLLNQGCYEFNKLNKKRGIVILEYLLESCTNYSDKAVTAYMLSLMYESRRMPEKAILVLTYAIMWRPGFSQANKRLDELKERETEKREKA